MENEPKANQYTIDSKDIPVEVRKYATDKLKGDDEDKKVTVMPAKEGGSYRGQVVLNSDQYLVQSVGKDKNFAIVHDKAKLNIQGDRLKWLNENDRLNNAGVQIHYSKDQAKMYPWQEKSLDEIAKAQEKAIADKEAKNVAGKDASKSIDKSVDSEKATPTTAKASTKKAPAKAATKKAPTKAATKKTPTKRRSTVKAASSEKSQEGNLPKNKPVKSADKVAEASQEQER